MTNCITQWTLPDIPKEPVLRPYQLYYPHFATSEIHNTLVDWYVDFPIPGSWELGLNTQPVV